MQEGTALRTFSEETLSDRSNDKGDERASRNGCYAPFPDYSGDSLRETAGRRPLGPDAR